MSDDEDVLEADVAGRRAGPAGGPGCRGRRAGRGWPGGARRRSGRSRRSRPGPRARTRARRRTAASSGVRRCLEGELDDVIAPEPGDQLAGRALGDDLAVVDDRDPVAEPLGLVHVMSGQDDRAAAVAEVADHVPELPAGLRVQAGRRLVEEQELGVADQRDARRPAAAAGRRRAAR